MSSPAAPSTTRSSRLGLLLCGAGRAAERYYIPALRGSSFELWAVVDTSAERRAWAGRRLCVATFGSAAEALASERFDAALIVTPPGSQCGIALDLVAAGVPVLIEKPAAGSQAEARGLLEAAGGVPVRLALARRYWRRYRRLRDGLQGEAESWSVEIETDPAAWGPYDTVQPHGLDGLVDDLLPHAFDIATSVLGVDVGRPDEAHWDGESLTLRFGGAASGAIRLRHGNGWLERVTWRASGGSERRVTSQRPLVLRVGERLAVAAQLRPGEQVEAVRRLFASFADDIPALTTNDDLIRYAVLSEEVKRLAGPESRSRLD